MIAKDFCGNCHPTDNIFAGHYNNERRLIMEGGIVKLYLDFVPPEVMN